MNAIACIGSMVLLATAVVFSQEGDSSAPQTDSPKDTATVAQQPQVVASPAPEPEKRPVPDARTSTTEPVTEAESPETPASPHYASPNALGFGAGSTSGIGFAFRRHFENRFGIHLSTIGWARKGDWESRYWFNAGGQLMYTFHRAERKFFRFYGLAGGEAIYYGYRENTWDPYTQEYLENQGAWNREFHSVVGAGIGMEFTIVQRIGIAIELPFTATFNNGELIQAYPIPNFALMYFF